MKTPYNGFATVYTENGMQFVMIEGGIKIPNIVKTIVTDDCNNDYATVQITLNCNIVENYSQALSIYKTQEE
jgi:hypothetical protein